MTHNKQRQDVTAFLYRSKWALARILVGLVVALYVFSAAGRSEVARLQLAFEKQAAAEAVAIIRGIETTLAVLDSHQRLYHARTSVTRQEFSDFVTPVLMHHPEIQAVEWIPYVTAATRAQYEAAAVQEGITDFRIVEHDGQGKLVPATARDAYYPVYFVEPLARNRAALGFDLASHAVRREALVRACDTGLPTATARVVLVQETGVSYGILIFLPIFRPQSDTSSAPAMAAERGQHLRGFVLGVIRIRSMIEAALQDIHDPHVHLQLFDNSAAPAERFLFATVSPQSTGTPSHDPFASVHWRSDFNVAGRQWFLQMFATPEHVQSLRTWERWGILAFFLTLSATQAAFLYANWKQTARIERLVAQRTAELRASTVRVHATMENVAEGIVTFDRHGRIESFNPAAERIFDYPTTEVVGQHLTLLLPTALQTPETLARRSGGDAAGWLTSTGLVGAEVVGRRGTGETFPLEITTSAMVLEGERLCIGVLRDLTEPKRAAQALQEARTARERMNGELRAAHDIQMGLLPRDFRRIMDTVCVDVHATLQPVREVGGDFYDIFLLEDGNLGFVVGDVSGKGVPASLHMAVTKTLLKAAARPGHVPPADVLRAVNDELCCENDTCIFVTAFFAILDVRTGALRYANAGPNPPLHVRADGHVAWLTGPGNVFGLVEDATWSTQHVTLTPGDCLLIVLALRYLGPAGPVPTA